MCVVCTWTQPRPEIAIKHFPLWLSKLFLRQGLLLNLGPTIWMNWLASELWRSSYSVAGINYWTWCLWVLMFVHQVHHLWNISLSPSTLNFVMGFLAELKVMDQPSWSESSDDPPVSPAVSYRIHITTSFFLSWFWGIQMQILMLHIKNFTDWIISPSSIPFHCLLSMEVIDFHVCLQKYMRRLFLLEGIRCLGSTNQLIKENFIVYPISFL